MDLIPVEVPRSNLYDGAYSQDYKWGYRYCQSIHHHLRTEVFEREKMLSAEKLVFCCLECYDERFEKSTTIGEKERTANSDGCGYCC